MLTQQVINEAVRVLADAAQPRSIVLFGSHARGEARADSDLDLLVVEDEVHDRAGEMVRLRRALRPMRIPVDILVASVAEVECRRLQPGHVLYWAMQEGREVYAGS